MDSSGELAVAGADMPFKRRRFVAYHQFDRNFFLIFLLVCWLGVVMGFAPPAMQRFSGHARYPAPLILKMGGCIESIRLQCPSFS